MIAAYSGVLTRNQCFLNFNKSFCNFGGWNRRSELFLDLGQGKNAAYHGFAFRIILYHPGVLTSAITQTGNNVAHPGVLDYINAEWPPAGQAES